MYFIYFIMPVILMIPVGIYVYFFLKRTAGFYKIPSDKKAAKLGIAFASLLLVIPAANIWGLWAVIALHFVLLAVCTDLLAFLAKKFFRKKKLCIPGSLYRCGLIPVLGTALILAYGYWNMDHVVETGYTVYTDKDIREEGYRIALISDLHFGTTMDGERLRQVCEKIAGEEPDLVVLCGDLVDENTSLAQMQEAFPILSSIDSSYGTYYVYGNHDRARYSSDPNFTEEQLAETLKSAGIRALADESVKINEEFTIFGREDWSVMERMDTQALAADADQDSFWLLADHQPKDLEQNSQTGYDLQVSGHTHGGQIWPVGLISDWLQFGEMNYGYRDMEGFQVIVTSGIAGWGYPVRTGHHSEYVMIDVMRQA